MQIRLRPLILGQKQFDFSRPYIVGICNVTPDSFSDGGNFFESSDAIDHIAHMIDNGADMIDLGAQSTRPGAQIISHEDEINRLAPILNVYKKRFNLPLSLDTTSAKVAQFGLDLGVDIINDISGFNFDPEMPRVIAKYQAGIILMHMQGTPQTMQANPRYSDVVQDIRTSLSISIEKAKAVSIQQIIIDPGIGFGKTVDHNLDILRHLKHFESLQCPILVGTSRKSFLGHITGSAVQDRLPESITSNLMAVINGAHFVRVHDVAAMNKAFKIYNAIKGFSL